MSGTDCMNSLSKTHKIENDVTIILFKYNRYVPKKVAEIDTEAIDSIKYPKYQTKKVYTFVVWRNPLEKIFKMSASEFYEFFRFRKYVSIVYDEKKDDDLTVTEHIYNRSTHSDEYVERYVKALKKIYKAKAIQINIFHDESISKQKYILKTNFFIRFTDLDFNKICGDVIKTDVTFLSRNKWLTKDIDYTEITMGDLLKYEIILKNIKDCISFETEIFKIKNIHDIYDLHQRIFTERINCRIKNVECNNCKKILKKYGYI